MYETLSSPSTSPQIPPPLLTVPSASESTTSSLNSKSPFVTSKYQIEVALKVIPKKKVKGNEASVWGEMEVLRGLDNPYIVRLVSLFHRDESVLIQI